MFYPYYMSRSHQKRGKQRDLHRQVKELHNPHYLLHQLQPVINKTVNNDRSSDDLTQLATISFLMGRGYDQETAEDIVSLWAKNNVFKH